MVRPTRNVRTYCSGEANAVHASPVGPPVFPPHGRNHHELTPAEVGNRRRPDTWIAGTLAARTAPGEFSASLSGLAAGRTDEVRAVVKHPLLPLYGRELRVRVP